MLHRAHIVLLALGFAFTALAQSDIQPLSGRIGPGGARIIDDDKGEGRRLMQSLINAPPETDFLMLGAFKTRNADDERTEIPVRWLVKPDGDRWHDVFETKSIVGRPAQRLIVTHQAGKPNAYALTQLSPGTNEFPLPRRLTGDELMQPFAGTDFGLLDLGLDFFHWPDARIVRTEMRKGRSCRVVQVINPSPAKGGYARVLCWIDVETSGLVRAEAFDTSNKLLKEFSIGKVSKVDGRWRLKELEMRNEQSDSRTTLAFDYEVAE